jgi:hypothetical protein
MLSITFGLQEKKNNITNMWMLLTCQYEHHSLQTDKQGMAARPKTPR